ncbi:MAG: hypothetical protein K9N49_00750 [Candidatus Marinimicrobia bacterium]|nr:hypothetical protein [Candidatus Neomarinimicrobiota bacterium]
MSRIRKPMTWLLISLVSALMPSGWAAENPAAETAMVASNPEPNPPASTNPPDAEPPATPEDPAADETTAPAETQWPTPPRSLEIPDEAPEPPATPLENFYRAYIRGRLAAGARVSTFKLDDNERPDRENSFLGSITLLDPIDDKEIHPVITYEVCRWLALGVSWDQVGAATVTHRIAGGLPGDMHSDGDIYLKGPVFDAYLRIPLTDWLVPYAGIGIARYEASFDPEGWWHWGFDDQYDARYDQWVARGSNPADLPSSKRRNMYVNSSDETAYTAGLEIRPAEHIVVDFFYRQMDISVDVLYQLTYREGTRLGVEERAEFPFKHYAYGASLKVMF